MKHLFIINPTAGKYNHSDEIIPLADKLMKGRGEYYETVLTQYPMHASKITRRLAESGEDWRVYVCGGDGTLNEAVQGAAGHPNISLTHFPCGTGNDFIRIFGKHTRRFSDLSELIDGEVKKVDLIECGDRYCLNICSIGFDARIGAEVTRFKRLPFIKGKGAYNLSIVYNLLLGLHQPYKVRIDGEVYDARYSMLVACNGRFYGGGFNPVPEAEPDDGYIDFLLAGPISPFTVAFVVGKFQSGRYAELPQYLKRVRGKRMDVLCTRENAVNIDGETIKTQEVNFLMSDQKLNFIVPKGADWNL